MKSHIALFLAVVAVVIAIFPSALKLGGTSNYDSLQVSKITIGTSGAGIGAIYNSTCTLSLGQGNTSYAIAASSTAAFDCPTPGTVSGDTIIFALATSSIATSGGFQIESQSASTTAASTRVHIRNNTGAAAILPASVGSSTPYVAIHLLSTTP